MAANSHPSNPLSGSSAADQVENQQYYHGLLPREDVKAMLQKEGDFLLRSSEPKKGEPRTIILSVAYNMKLEEEKQIKHLPLNPNPNRQYSLGKYTYESIPKMIEYHVDSKDSIRDDIYIKHAINRQSWELSHNSIEIQKKLGEGAFGEVSMGLYKMRNGRSVKVAVKQAKLEKATKEQIKEFMGEARVMRAFFHPNVVRFYGVAAGQEPLYMVMELASNGALDSYLSKNTDIPIETKNQMILQAAWGLDYVHKKNVLHRDIASRNCLYGDGQVKISDFGLSRQGPTYQMDPSRRVPIRWLAIETLRTQMYSFKTDVWSYGIMCWEIYNNGSEPYPGMTVAEVNQGVREGYRMELPPTVQPEISQLIKAKCWAENQNDRYTMPEICTNLERILKIHRPDFAAHENQQKAELAGPGQMTKKGKKKGKAPKGMQKKDRDD